MKTDFNIHIDIELGVSDSLLGVLRRLAPAAAPAQGPVPAMPPVTAEEKPAAQPQTPAEETPAGAAPADDAGVAPVPTPEDVRRAMHEARMRIEGEDYKDHPGNKMHLPMTEAFKALSRQLCGQARPSALPETSRADFIAATRTIAVCDDGQLFYTVSAA
ncbi:MAG: hypothetical protein IKI72_09085 [Bacteroidales bacterium]|nr:hypothetical protein [Bacteroidales bacterium]